MKVFVHLGYDPVPKQLDSLQNAITLVENFLRKESGEGEDDSEDPSSKWKIMWRRDDLYPDNFYDYTHENLIEELKTTGNIVLQSIKQSGDDSPLLGAFANIYRDDIEKKHDEEADSALEKTEECLERKQLDLHGESLMPLRRRKHQSRKK